MYSVSVVRRYARDAIVLFFLIEGLCHENGNRICILFVFVDNIWVEWKGDHPPAPHAVTLAAFLCHRVQIKELVFILQKAKLIILVKTSKAARRSVVIYNLMRGDGCGFFVRSYEWEGLKIVCGWILCAASPLFCSCSNAETIKYEIKFTDDIVSSVGKPIRITRDYEHGPKERPLKH